MRLGKYLIHLLALLLISIASNAQAEQIFQTTFDGPPALAWSSQSVSKTPSGLNILGPFGNKAVSLHLEKLPDHEYLTIEVEVIAIGGWVGETSGARWEMQLANHPSLVTAAFGNAPPRGGRSTQRLFDATLPNRTGATQENITGINAGPYGDTLYKLTFVVPHRDASMRLFFTGSGITDESQMSWAIRSLKVTSGKPEPLTNPNQLEAAWAALGENDLAQASKAMAQFESSGLPAAKFLYDQLIEKTDDERLSDLIARLDHPDYAERERVTEILKTQGNRIHPELRRAARDASPERAWRIMEILAAPPTRTVDPNSSINLAQQLYAVRAISRSNAPEAMSLLSDIAERSTIQQVTTAANLAVTQTKRAYLLRLLRDPSRLDEAVQFSEANNQIGRVEIEWTKDRLAAIEQAKQAIASLKNKPDQAEELALLQLLAVNDPPAALKTAEAAKLPIAKNIRAILDQDVSAADRLAAAEWLLQQPRDERPIDWPSINEHAARMVREVLQRSRQLDPAPDEKLFARIETLNQQITDQILADLESKSGWIDALALWRGERDTIRGEWEARDGSLVVKPGNFSITRLPISPLGSYEMKIRFRRTINEEGIFIQIPVGESAGNLNLGGWGGGFSGFEIINGAFANENRTTVRDRYPLNQSHELHVRVSVANDRAVVNVERDGRAYLSWSGEPGDLGVSQTWNNKRDPNELASFAIGGHVCGVIFEQVLIRATDSGLKIEKRDE